MKIKLLFLSMLFSVVAFGQVNISAGSTITQDFSSLGTTSIGTFTNNTTLPGWYITTAGLPINTGTTNANSCYNFGILGTNPLADRALGALSTGTTHRFGLRLTNNGATTITSFNISFTGEQWRSFAAGTLVFEYQIGTTITSLTAGTWTAVTALDFANLTTSAGAATDGNNTSFRTAKSTTLNANVPPANEIFFRWTKAGTSSAGLAIDDLSVTASATSSVITTSASTLSGMTYVFGSGPSGETTFNASGTGLTANILLTAPTDYEISTTSGSGFGSTVTLTQAAGVVASTPIYVRLKSGLAVASYNLENIALTSAGASTVNVACSGTVTAAPAANDLCASAIGLVINAAAVTGNMTGSTFTAPFTKKDVWYSFTPTCTGTHVVTVTGFSGDMDIELFSGSCPATTTTLDSSSSTSSTESTSTTLTAGVTYYLRVLAYDITAETSAFTVQVASSSTLTLSNSGSPATGNIPAATTNAVIMGFTTTPGCTTSYNVTSVKLTKSAVSTALSTDISNFRVVYDIDGNGVMNGAETSVSGAGIPIWATTSVFTLTGQTGITTARKYLLVADIAPAAVNGRTIKVNISPNTDLVTVLTPAGAGTGTALGNTQTITPPVCTSATVASVTPASGPVGTQVTITASSGSLVGATATFNGVAATVVSSSATQLVILVPVGATTGNLVITDAQPCNATVAFTVINNDVTSCQGTGNTFTDLIISEVYDSFAGNVWHMELYNPTNAAINLDAVGANYRLERYGTIGDLTPTRTVDISGIVLPGATYLADLGTITDPSCAKSFDFTSYAQGINELDAIKLTKENVLVDIVHCPNEKGYTIKRLVTATGPKTVFAAGDWTTLSTEDCSDLGFFAATLNVPPTISTQPTVSLTCTTASAVLTVGATEGFAGGNALVYQWYYAAPGDVAWTPILADGGFYSGSATSSLTITPLISVQDYQYYCQVRENSATCYKATVAVQISGNYSTTWSGSAWSNGVPTLSKLAIIKGNYDMTLGGAVTSFDACSVLVKSPAIVTVISLKYINIQNNLTIDAGATLNVLNNGSLVQIDDTGVNTVNGTFNMQRTASVKQYDYVFWSSPTLNFPLVNVSPTTPLSLIFKWTPTVATNFGTWINANENMTKGKGYIVRTPNSFTQAAGQTLTATFTGLPNNGIIPLGIERGDYQGADYISPANGYVNVTKYDDNENLIGNPYPSAIKASKFLLDPANANIDGFVQVWSHGTQPLTSTVDPFYGDYTYNYTAADFIVYNGTATSSGPTGFNGYIGAGQGFFVTMLDGAADATKSVTFNNGMREFDYDNSQFYKSGNVKNPLDMEALDKSRIWLDLVSPTKQVNRMVVGYVDGATLGRDRIFDAVVKVVEKEQNFYSVLDKEPFQIQGRPLPFDNNDKVTLGLNITQKGDYSIAIGASDGLFLDQKNEIYLEDKKLNIIHDLKASPYLFTSEIDKNDGRFVLRFNNKTLEPDTTGNDVIVTNGNNQIGVKSLPENIKDIVVFDVLGRFVYTKNNINAQDFFINDLNINNQALIVKITLENNQVIVKKILF